MKPSQTIFNRDQGTVTISEKEYNKLLQYRELCREFKAVLGEGGAKWVTSSHQPILKNMTLACVKTVATPTTPAGMQEDV